MIRPLSVIRFAAYPGSEYYDVALREGRVDLTDESDGPVPVWGQDLAQATREGLAGKGFHEDRVQAVVVAVRARDAQAPVPARRTLPDRLLTHVGTPRVPAAVGLRIDVVAARRDEAIRVSAQCAE